jgi:hypothetical protein
VPRKRRVFTQEQITAIVKKRNATRARRGTMGRKQRKAIKGVVPAETPAPVQVVAPAAPAAQPAVVASAAVLLAVVGAAVPDATPPAQAQAASPPTASTATTVEGSETSRE